MSEDVKRRGRPPKDHLRDEHHFRTSEEAVAAGAPPAAAESDQADTSGSATMPHSISAEPIIVGTGNEESVIITVENEEIKSAIKESPIEEKIHQLVNNSSLNGWHPIDTEIVLQMPPRNGMGVKLSETPDGDGVLALWKKTRKFANPTHRWQESGKWVDFHSGMDILFQPKYWKERF